MNIVMIGIDENSLATGRLLKIKGHSVTYTTAPSLSGEKPDLDRLETLGHKVAYTFSEIIPTADFIFIADKTPKIGLVPSPTHVLEALKSIEFFRKEDAIVVIKSYLPPNTMPQYSSFVPPEKLIYSPDFYNDSENLMAETIYPDRVAVGSWPKDNEASRDFEALYNDATITFFHTTWEVAEQAAFLVYTFLDFKEAFFNQAKSNLSPEFSQEVMKIVGLDRRISL